MKTILCRTLLLCAISTSLAAVLSGRFFDPSNPKKCTLDNNTVLSPGKHKAEGTECGLIVCHASSEADFYTCATREMALPGFKYGGYVNASRPFPQCCEREILDTSPKNYRKQLDEWEQNLHPEEDNRQF